MPSLTRAQREYRAPKIADKIRARMATLGLSQSQVAARAGISPGTFVNVALRHSTKNPTLQRLGSISVALGWPVDYLAGLMDGTYDLSDDPAALPDRSAPVVDEVPAAPPRPWAASRSAAPAEFALRRDITALTERVAALERLVASVVNGKETLNRRTG